MPAPGDQHNGDAANPFEETRPRVSEYTAQQIAILQCRLQKQLGPEYISSRAGPGGVKVHYITSEKCIALANEVFGFNGWSSSIQNITVDFVDEHPQTLRVSLGLSVVVRVTLRDGTYHEDIGYGNIENCKGKASAFEKAKKQATTDALKRALRNFGNVLGNCIYDKDYLSKVIKIKPAPTKFDEQNLHRHPDFVKKEVVPVKAPVRHETKPEPEPEIDTIDSDLFEDFGDFDDADFCIVEEGHPDEVVLPNPSRPSAPSAQNKPPEPVNRAPQTPNQGPRFGGPAVGVRQQPPQVAPRPVANAPNLPGPRPHVPGPSEPVAFFSARAVNKDIPESSLTAESGLIPKAQQLFNPKAESPSIRKTPGIDHNSSKPVTRNAVQSSSQAPASPAVPSAGPGSRPGGGFQSGIGNVVNPHLNQARRIGTPGGGASPLANRGQYRPPTMKRPLPGDGNGARPALTEVSTNSAVGLNDGAFDAKRQKTA
ncbi:DNA repair and recombination protein rhm52 [Scedosporium apiospermum]|uniref:RAD52 homolog n=1 Tax=Pseudallescheria apiosperma TaxID=563466 RepID=A0A084FUL7_PSEDA|nr:DNA repair and recombination protein rhm52 [Scedosporium apiospermum]KEZ38779.1 DNA repair and recombination protein rhm52 [Scedosporium apiospermum]